MYEAHFQLRQAPFSIAPDPEFLYLSNGHREALAHLTYGLTQGGFVLITGEVGTGKTTLLRNLLNQMPPDVDVAFILNPRLTVRELLETICDELGIEYSRTDRSSIKNYVDALSAHLLQTHAAGRSTLLIIDEAQNLAPAVLEQIRLLTNLETDKRKLLRIILLGQPELLELLGRKELRQLAQRITARYHLRGLDRHDTFAYVIHRLQRAGGNALIFTRPALARLYRISGGIPRLINLIADRAMLGTYAAGRHRVSWRMIGRASREVLGIRQRHSRWIGAGAVAAAIGVAIAGILFFEHRGPTILGQSGATEAEDQGDPVPSDAAGTKPADPEPSVDPPAAQAPVDGTPVEWTATAPVVSTPAESAHTAPVVSTHAESAHTAPGDGMTVESAPMDAPPSEPAAGGPEIVAPAAGEAPAPAPAQASQLVRPDMTTLQTQRLAYQAAFSRWGADFSVASLSVIPCDFAPTAGLQCLGGSGTWNDLRSLNLPAVLELWDAGPSPYYGALTAMSGDTVTLNIGGVDYRFDLRTLADNWFGGYVLLWRMPPDYRGSLKQGDRHPSIGWVRQQFETLGIAKPGAADPDTFDPGLRDAVTSFQTSEHMLADGVIGPMTWIRLAQRLGLPQPTLHD